MPQGQLAQTECGGRSGIHRTRRGILSALRRSVLSRQACGGYRWSNSGIEAAIDLAGICRKVTVFEFADTLKADQVLQEKARSLPNVEIFTSSQTIKVDGNGEKVTSIRIKDRLTGEERDFPLDGIFVQIGLAANSAPFATSWKRLRPGRLRLTLSAVPHFRGYMRQGMYRMFPTSR